MDRGLLGPWPWEEPPPSGGRRTNRVRVVLPGHPVLPADPGQDRTDRIDVSERREDLTRRSPGGHREPHPGGCRPHVRSAEGKQFDDNVIGDFCHYNYFFPSEEEARRWAEGQPRDFLILTIEEGFELMTRIAGVLYGDALEAGGEATDRRPGETGARRHRGMRLPAPSRGRAQGPSNPNLGTPWERRGV